ncbi:MAG: hypothetical protein M3328_05710, partial [Chloroflexota bacterium]|nr:hypothetical protein [Chloroflexota bacterium]
MARYKPTLQSSRPKVNIAIITTLLALCLGVFSLPSAAPASAETVQETGQMQYAPSSVVFST